MADTKISALPEQTEVNPSTLIPTVDGGTNKRLTVANLQSGIVTGSASITTQELTVEQFITFEVQGSLPSGGGKGKQATGGDGNLYYVNPSGTVYLLNIDYLNISDDYIFKASGSAIDFGRNLDVAVTGSSVFVKTPDALLMPVLTGTSQPDSGYQSLYAQDDGLYLLNGASGSLLSPHGGWIPASEQWVFSSSDAPSYVIHTPEDVTGKYSPGMRIRFNQGSNQYGILTDVSAVSGSHTLLTFYGGTDYSATGSSITSSYYSREKAPHGFPLSPTKWREKVTDTSQRTQATPTQNVWYNMGSFSIDLPIGSWRVRYSVLVQKIDATLDDVSLKTTLSTANNSESDSEFTNRFLIINAGVISGGVGNVMEKEKHLDIGSKTTYYLNTLCGVADIDNMYNLGNVIPSVIEAISAYL